MNPRKAVNELQALGQRGDTMLAHINPLEAALLMELGGSGVINPDTGLPQFYADPEGQADASRPDGTPGVEAQGGFGGPVSPETPNTDMPVSDQYAEYGQGRQIAEQQNGYGYGASQNWLGDAMSQYNAIPQQVRSGINALVPGAGMVASVGNFLNSAGFGTNTGGATGITQSASDAYAPRSSEFDRDNGGIWDDDILAAIERYRARPG